VAAAKERVSGGYSQRPVPAGFTVAEGGTLWHLPVMSITATVENDMIRLPANVHLPDGTQVRLEPIDPGQPSRIWPPGYFARTAGMLAGDRLERPEQGTTEKREAW
jgi:hypothetical protein